MTPKARLAPCKDLTKTEIAASQIEKKIKNKKRYHQ